MNALQTLIDTAWEQRSEFSPKSAPAEVRVAVAHVLAQLGERARGREKRRSMAGQSVGRKKPVLFIVFSFGGQRSHARRWVHAVL